MSRQLFWAFPAVLRVECSSLARGGGEVSLADANADLAVDDSDADSFRDHPIQELVFRNSAGFSSSAPRNLEQMFFRMSCLVDICVQGYELDGVAVLHLTCCSSPTPSNVKSTTGSVN
ncbi:hypothetical protein BGZ96_012181 [Linnemannia gamsii]|uniref:Uncharacterized protein n=1 Tax=Linnemannia gamsii TaxID=64522 RepID=A0ABQ7KCM6_9FUNG|nr:hypothetical protein BGZ96_012181 [Linnemannia gamsii]